MFVLSNNSVNAMTVQNHNDSEEFINSIKFFAMKQYKKYNILPSLIIAQAILETGSGKSILCRKAHNLFGIKTKGNWKGKIFKCLTSEYINNRKVSVVCKFRAYDTMEESIEDHSKFLLDSRYYPVRKADDYNKACVAIQKCGYATSPSYAYRLISLIKKNKLQQYDEIAKHMES